MRVTTQLESVLLTSQTSRTKLQASKAHTGASASAVVQVQGASAGCGDCCLDQHPGIFSRHLHIHLPSPVEDSLVAGVDIPVSVGVLARNLNRTLSTAHKLQLPEAEPSKLHTKQAPPSKLHTLTCSLFDTSLNSTNALANMSIFHLSLNITSSTSQHT